MSKIETTDLFRLASGLWIAPGSIKSIASFPAEILPGGKERPNRVVLKTERDAFEWVFETMEDAVAHADRLAGIYNGVSADA